MNKKYALVGLVAVVLLGVSFYGGMQYEKNSESVARKSGNLQGAGSRFQQFGASAGQVFTGRQGVANGGFTTGEILSNDGKILTLKLKDGGTSLVLLSGGTSVSKFATGAASDLAVGKQVMVSGDRNSDGSLNAKSIQIQPEQAKPQQ